jgi:hypothetical protein
MKAAKLLLFTIIFLTTAVENLLFIIMTHYRFGSLKMAMPPDCVEPEGIGQELECHPEAELILAGGLGD